MIIFVECWGVGAGRAVIQISFRASTQSSRPQGWQRPLQIMLSVEAEEDVWSHPPAPAAVLGTTALPNKHGALTDRHTDTAGRGELQGVEHGSCEQHAALHS